jgi:ATP-binding cassette subfamily C (CFTR/MRP) protein 1
MDEATAAVDPDTDKRIQEVMRTEFATATCITVAHRLNTIMDSDLILVMDGGRAAEFDSPNALLERGGMFSQLVEAAAASEQTA